MQGGILGDIRDIRVVYLFGEFKVYGTFLDELCLLMIGFDRGQRIPKILSTKH